MRLKQKSMYRTSDGDLGSQELTSKATVHTVCAENGTRLGDEATGSYSTHASASRSFIAQNFLKSSERKEIWT